MITDTGRAPHPQTDGEPGNAQARMPGASTRNDQRSRLLAAIVEIVAKHGYPDAKIADIVRSAGVSRATFYELFENKEACLLAAQAQLTDRIGLQLEDAVSRGDAGRAAHCAITALVELAHSEPQTFNFLTHESMLGGSAAQAQRDRLIGRLAHAIERAWERGPASERMLDMSARLLLEGSIRLLGMRMRRDGDAPRQLLGELLSWVDSYTVTTAAPRWRALTVEPAFMQVKAEHPKGFSLPPSLPRGRHRLGSELAKGVQRERIAYATAAAVRAKGFADITVADIVTTAGVSRDAFYGQFHDKNEAFDGAAQLVFERLLATMAGAFFSDAGDWADQVWQAGWALEQFLESEPSLASFLFIATYGPPARIGRVLDFVMAFTLFVEGGNRSPLADAQVSRTVTEAIVCAVLEVVNFQIRHCDVQALRGLMPRLAHMVYAPFIGTERAEDLVAAKIRAVQRVLPSDSSS
jgi:AcrR family transcriptional regulator